MSQHIPEVYDPDAGDPWARVDNPPETEREKAGPLEAEDSEHSEPGVV